MIGAMATTSKQRRELKRLGQTMSDDVRLGKAGLNDAMVAHVRDLLGRKELVKLRFTELEGPERKAFAQEVAGAVGAECIAVVGRTLLLYLPKAEESPASKAADKGPSA